MTKTNEELKTVTNLGVDLNKKVTQMVGEFIREHMDEIGTNHNAFLVAGAALSATLVNASDKFHPDGMLIGVQEFIDRLETTITDLALLLLADKLGVKV